MVGEGEMNKKGRSVRCNNDSSASAKIACTYRIIAERTGGLGLRYRVRELPSVVLAVVGGGKGAGGEGQQGGDSREATHGGRIWVLKKSWCVCACVCVFRCLGTYVSTCVCMYICMHGC